MARSISLFNHLVRSRNEITEALKELKPGTEESVISTLHKLEDDLNRAIRQIRDMDGRDDPYEPPDSTRIPDDEYYSDLANDSSGA